jgi:hypothetical protein
LDITRVCFEFYVLYVIHFFLGVRHRLYKQLFLLISVLHYLSLLFLLQVRMVVWGGGRSGWATPPGLAVLLLVLLWAGSVSPAPFKEDWPESWQEATDLAFPETGKSKHKNRTN